MVTPPASRRPGFSRRAQYGLFAGYMLAISGALFGLLMVITAHYDPDGHNALRGVVQDISSPVASAGRELIGGGRNAYEAVAAYIDAGSKNRAMGREVAADRTAIVSGRNAIFENSRLRALLKMEQSERAPVVAGQIVSSMGENSRTFAILNKGHLAGVTSGEPVRGPDGLVGLVVQTGAISAQVLLISDTGAVVPVRRASDGLPAFSRGLGDGRLTLTSAVPGINPFKVGDTFVTSGTGGVYAPGIPVAIVIGIDHDGAIARPFADPARLDFALVEPQFVTAPPAPTEIKTKTVHHNKGRK
ncbi:MAG: rod shape-determining protein MreC [Alphaproteobacteria bacterium]|nr:rod shape-determining protein MreC [Alphaproteobacteria bacterium]MDE2341749.1 rod shape-determining protein MreC [Alphaproteobacteria bacterium]